MAKLHHFQHGLGFIRITGFWTTTVYLEDSLAYTAQTRLSWGIQLFGHEIFHGYWKVPKEEGQFGIVQRLPVHFGDDE
jgi:hypothetical protein